MFLVSSLFAFDLVSSVRAVTDFDIFKAATDYAIMECVFVCVSLWNVECVWIVAGVCRLHLPEGSEN